jgi:hypothetical protein
MLSKESGDWPGVRNRPSQSSDHHLAVKSRFLLFTFQLEAVILVLTHAIIWTLRRSTTTAMRSEFYPCSSSHRAIRQLELVLSSR